MIYLHFLYIKIALILLKLGMDKESHIVLDLFANCHECVWTHFFVY